MDVTKIPFNQNAIEDVIEATKPVGINAFYKTKEAKIIFETPRGKILSEEEAKVLFIKTLKELT